MKKQERRIATQSKGFTLIELLVVIAIIGLLSSVVLASLNTARQKGRDSRRVADVKQIQLALELYYDSFGSYPDALSTANLVDNGYISVVPTDPSTDAGYFYDQLGGGTSYCLGASLEDINHQALDTDVDDSSNCANVEGADNDGCDDVDGYCYDVQP